VKKILLNLAVAALAVAFSFASCQRPLDVDAKTIYNRQAIDLMAEGERYEKQGNYRLALDRYGKALDLSPRPALYYHIGSCYYKMGEYRKAYDYLTAAVRLAGDYPAAQYLLSKVRIQLALAKKRGAAPSATPTAPTPRPTRVAAATPKPTRATPRPTRTTPAPKPTPREVATARPTPKPPEVVRTPRRTPTPRPALTPARTPKPTPARTPSPPVRTPATTPRRTPIQTASRTPVGPPSHPIVRTPPPRVEHITPTPAPRTGLAPTPRPRAAKPLPPLSPSEVFPELYNGKETDITAPTELSTATTTVSPILSQWKFHWDRAQSFLQRKMYQEAVDELLLVLGAQPRHLDARLALADTYDKLGRGEKALDEYEKARIYHPNNPKPYFRTGNYYLRHAGENPKYYDLARSYYFKAISIAKNYYFAYHNTAVSYMEQGDYERARKYFEWALAIKPDYASAHRNLGILYEQYLHNPKAALRHYREYVRLGGPDADEVREWIKALESAP